MTEAAAMLKAKDAAAYLAVSVHTLRRLRLPRYLLGERIIRWSRADLDAYLATCRVESPGRVAVDARSRTPRERWPGDRGLSLLEFLGSDRGKRSKKKAA